MDRESVVRVLLLAVLAAGAGCSKAPQLAPQREAPSPVRMNARSAFTWHYQARLEARGDLRVVGRFDGATDGEFSVYDELVPFVHQFEVAQGRDWQPITPRESSFRVPCRSGCIIRYRFALRDAAQRLAEADTVIASGDVVISPPSTWLLHPGIKARTGDFELSVDPGPNARFVSAFQPVSGDLANHYQAPI